MEQKVKTWRDFMPSYVQLYYVDYQDTLKDNVNSVQTCISNNDYSGIWDIVDSCWESDWQMAQIRESMKKAGMEGEFEKNQDEIREWLYENDTSTPVQDLIRNTGNIPWFYSLGHMFSDSWGNGYYNANMIDQDIKSICETLNIPESSSQVETIKELRENAFYGGELRIYFKCPLDRLISLGNDFKNIRFKGRFTVAIHDCNNGSGDFQSIDLDLTLEFNRDNLFHAKCEKYNIYEVYGIYDSCLEDAIPELLLESEAVAKSVLPSFQSAYLEAENKYNKTFQAGKCTFGDMDIKRHRNLEYVQKFPCGWHCKDCNTFWID